MVGTLSHDPISQESSLEEGGFFPVRKDDSVNLADGDTSLVVLGSVPVGDSISHVSLDLSAVGEGGLGGVDLPVGVLLGALDGVDLVVISIRDINVLGVGGANGGVVESHSLVTLDGAQNGGPLLGLDGGDEGVGIVSDLLVGLEALVDEGADISSIETEEDTSLEVGGGGGGDSVLLGKVHGVGGSGEHIVFK